MTGLVVPNSSGRGVVTITGVVLVDPVTGKSYAVGRGSESFDPDTYDHVYAYNDGKLVTDTATNGVDTWVKTYTYTGEDLTGETRWVKQ